ncbi:hypothetical protein GINT2_000448 [Glugoides intestinalis]
MGKKVNNKFQWLFHLAVVRKVRKENPTNYKEKLSELAIEVGARITDDFCSRFGVFEKVSNDDVQKYLNLFLDYYFENDVKMAGKELKLENEILKYECEQTLFFIKEILNCVFKEINEAFLLEINNGKLVLRN